MPLRAYQRSWLRITRKAYPLVEPLGNNHVAGLHIKYINRIRTRSGSDRVPFGERLRGNNGQIAVLSGQVNPVAYRSRF